jgi:hypothetical protein
VGGRAVTAIDLGNEVAAMSRRIRASRKAERPVAALSIYDGQVCVGEILDRGLGRVLAYQIGKGGRHKIATFAIRRDAMRALAGDRA